MVYGYAAEGSACKWCMGMLNVSACRMNSSGSLCTRSTCHTVAPFFFGLAHIHVRVSSRKFILGGKVVATYLINDC